MPQREFKAALQSLRSPDFAIYDEEIDKMFLILTRQARVSASAVASIDELVIEVYSAVKAVMVHLM